MVRQARLAARLRLDRCPIGSHALFGDPGLTIHLPVVMPSLDASRAIRIERFETDRHRASGLTGFCRIAIIQLRPRQELCQAKIQITDAFQVLWDHPNQTVRWVDSFDEAFPDLALIALGEFLDHHEVPVQPDPSCHAFTLRLDTDIFSILQRPAAPEEQVVLFLKGRTYWAWKFGLDHARLERADAARLGLELQDLVRLAQLGEGEHWNRVGDRALRATPSLLRSFSAVKAETLESGETVSLGLLYDVALSFAGEQRAYVEEVAKILKNAAVKVFYDSFEDLWGVDLTVKLEDVYRRQSRYVVIFVSGEYVEKAWPNLERQHALAGRIERNDESVLPARFSGIELPGLPATVGYLDISHMTPAELASRILRKLGHGA